MKVILWFCFARALQMLIGLLEATAQGTVQKRRSLLKAWRLEGGRQHRRRTVAPERCPPGAFPNIRLEVAPSFSGTGFEFFQVAPARLS